VFWYAVIVVLIFILVVAFFPKLLQFKIESAEERQTAYLHTLQVALERHAVAKDDKYPATIEALIDEFLLEMPPNPYTGQPMKHIPFGSTPCEGDITYVPYHDGEAIIGYYVIAYGSPEEDGLDVDGDNVPDHVYVVLETSIDIPLDIPPLVELLRAE